VAKIPKAITDMSTLSRVIFDPDATPPSTPTNVVGTPVSSSRIDLSWSASTDTGGSGLAGYLVYRNTVFLASASATGYSDTGLVASTSYQYQVAAVDSAGNVSTLSTVINVTTQANLGPPTFAPIQPATAFIGISGVRAFTDTTQIAAIGRYDYFVTGIWEAWANSGRDFDTTAKAIKAASTAPAPTLVFAYINLNVIEEDVNDPRPTWTTEVVARNWKLYAVGTTPPGVGSSGLTLVNYTDFVPTNPNLEHPYEFGAKYSYWMLLSKSKGDARFSALNAGLASSSVDGIFPDNFLLDPRSNGDWNRDGTTEGTGLPCAVTPWLCAGQLRYVNTLRTLAPTKYVVANSGDYGVTTAGVMVGQLDGMLCESYMGKSWSRETLFPFLTMLQNYYSALAATKNPHLVIFGGSWPNPVTDPSSLPKNTQWQWARYIAATAYLGEGMSAINQFDNGYSSDLSALDWYDFYGGVNGLARSWLGAPVDTLRPTTPKIAKGPIGLFGVEYQNGIIVVNPKGNGTQTVTNSDIPGTWKFLTGTQDPVRDSGATFSSVSLPERDGLFLQRVIADGASLVSNVVTLRRAAGGFTTKATPAPLYYNNFESLSVGAAPSATGLTNSIDATVVNVQADRSCTGTKCMKGVFPANTESFPEVSYLPPANTAEIYVSGMMYWSVASPPQSGSPIFKLTRMGAGVLYHGQPSQYQTVRPSSGVVNGGDWGYTTGSFVAWPSSLYWGSPNTLPGPHSDQWNFMEWAHCIGNPSGSAVGYSESRCNGQNAFAPTTIAGHSAFVNQTTGANVTTGNTNNSGANAFFTWVIPFFDGMSGPGSNATSLWVDELYIDNCRNRVVVTDNAVFASSTKFLMLVCSVWLDGQITGTNAALTTMFPSGSTAYFHIFSSSGAEVVAYSKVMP
jgi:Fibronectin type III domain